MKYQAGDMLKVNYGSWGDFICIISEQLPSNKFQIFWLTERGYVQNADRSWRVIGGEVLDTSFKRIS